MPNVLPEGMNHEEVRLLRQQAQKTVAHPIRTNEPLFSLFLFGSVRSVFRVFPLRLRSDPRAVLFKGRLGEERPEQHQHRRHERERKQPPHAQACNFGRHQHEHHG